MTVSDLIAALQQMVPYQERHMHVVAEYDGGLYPVISVRQCTIQEYGAHYDLKEGETVLEIVYAEYQ